MDRSLILAVACSLPLIGCVIIQGSTASIYRECPPRGTEGVETIHLKVEKATGDMQFHPHVGVGNVVQHYEFIIPFMPAERKSFDIREISLREAHPHTNAPASGEVVVDPRKREIIVALKSTEGDFPANGTYPIKFDLPSPSPREKQASCVRPPVAAHGWHITEAVAENAV